jgi:hypothetical protein
MVAMFLAGAVPSAAQEAYPPNGPGIPAIRLNGSPPSLSPRANPPDQQSQWNTELVGHSDLQGRSAYQPIIISQDGREIAYVGHHASHPVLNPLTGKVEPNGTSVVDVTDPAKPKYLAHIPGAAGDEAEVGGSQMVRVCSGNVLPRGVKGKHRRSMTSPILHARRI